MVNLKVLLGTAIYELSVKPNSQRPPETLGNRWSTTTDQKVRGSNPFKRTSIKRKSDLLTKFVSSFFFIWSKFCDDRAAVLGQE